MPSPAPSSLTLIDFWRSGTSHRTRIALHLKGLDFEHRPLDLRAGAQASSDYLGLNPQGLVPTLIADGAAITQSPAILEWLEEVYPAPPLLPADPAARARVRAIAAAVACDIHPLGNLRVLKYLRSEMGQDEPATMAFARRWIELGFDAIEKLVAPEGPWAWGAEPTLADCCLVPQLYAAIDRHKLTLSPRLAEIHAASEKHPAFIAAHPLNQSDSPK